MSLRESVSMTYRQLEDELELLYPGMNRGEAARQLAVEMGGYSHRTIAAYVYGHRRIVPQFISKFADFYSTKTGKQPDEFLQKLKIAAGPVAGKKIMLADSKMLMRIQRAVDQMCLSCAGATVQDGGFCWDSGCPLVEFTRYPLKENAKNE